jgi:isopentenyldiphosphate isomerase
VKRAAVRKLLHELGIPASDVPLAKFKFLTRLHYWAADTVTHGPQSPWGEHEIDYILFIQGVCVAWGFGDWVYVYHPACARSFVRDKRGTGSPAHPPIHINITAKVRVSPNPEEVQATKYVTQAELREMMAEDSGLLWSPWFRYVRDFIYNMCRFIDCDP